MEWVQPEARRKNAWLRPAATICGIYVLPVVLVATGAIPFYWRFHVLLLMTLVAGSLAVSRHSAMSLGLRLPRWRALMGWSLIPTALAIAGILQTDLPHRHVAPGRLAFYVFFVLVPAPAQEFLYRSFLFAEMGEIRVPPVATVALSAVLFAFLHIIYRDAFTMLLTLVAGLAWAVLFHKTRGFYMVAASHAALGAAAILTGVI